MVSKFFPDARTTRFSRPSILAQVLGSMAAQDELAAGVLLSASGSRVTAILPKDTVTDEDASQARSPPRS
jgi:hypothetical protein